MDRARRWPGGPYCWMFCVAGILVMQTHDSAAVEITRLTIPRHVRNGTEDGVVLDCEYDYTQNDLRLVIKWFLDDDPEPLYQWIPELNKRHVGTKLEGRLNLNFTVTPSNKYTKFRALYIIDPTTDLTGKYSCHVGSLANQDSAEQMMIVYAPAKHFDFSFTKVTPTLTNLTCEAEGLFPEPQIALYRLSPGEVTPEEVKSTKQMTSKRNGIFRISLSSQLMDNELPPDGATTFECVLVIPGTDYQRHKKLDYYPGPHSSHKDGHLSSRSAPDASRNYGSRTAAVGGDSSGGVSRIGATLTTLIIFIFTLFCLS